MGADVWKQLIPEHSPRMNVGRGFRGLREED